LNTSETFDTITEASKKYNNDISNISSCCQNKFLYSGKNEKGEKLVWAYYEDYLKMTEEDIKNRIDKTNKKGKNSHKAKSVICLNTLEIFDTITEASLKLNISLESICMCCKHRRNSVGKNEKGEKLVWCYYNEYLEMTEQEIKDKIEKAQNHSSTKKIICLETLKIFDNMFKIQEIYNISSSNICVCCQGKIKSAGRDADGNKLHWMYYSEYLNLKKEE
jgi:molybdopterin synthase catalytic subunit